MTDVDGLRAEMMEHLAKAAEGGRNQLESAVQCHNKLQTMINGPPSDGHVILKVFSANEWVKLSSWSLPIRLKSNTFNLLVDGHLWTLQATLTISGSGESGESTISIQLVRPTQQDRVELDPMWPPKLSAEFGFRRVGGALDLLPGQPVAFPNGVRMEQAIDGAWCQSAVSGSTIVQLAVNGNAYLSITVSAS